MENIESMEHARSPVADTTLVDRITDSLMRVVTHVPGSREVQVVAPAARAKAVVRRASSKAALVSGTLALPSGPIGMFTILPDLFEIWNIQKQMVADLAAVYGKTHQLGPREMIYCLFRHAAGQVVRDVVVRVGQRFLVRDTTLRVVQRVLRGVGVSIAQRTAGRSLSRWIPVAGAVGIGGYAFYDTGQVGKTAMEFFEQEILRENAGADEGSVQ